jgi:hypothetical protein
MSRHAIEEQSRHPHSYCTSDYVRYRPLRSGLAEGVAHLVDEALGKESADVASSLWLVPMVASGDPN